MPQLVIALDFNSRDKALSVVKTLQPLPLWYKVGLELFTNTGPLFVEELTRSGKKVFLDLKFHDIPHTVRGACRSAASLGIEMLTVHTTGGLAMMEAALAGREDVFSSQKQRPIILGVTLLTSDGSLGDNTLGTVVTRALEAKKAGLDGVVCSGKEASAIKKACGETFICLCPGIRFAHSKGQDDQARVCTPEEATSNGADFLIMGRPILQANVPFSAAQEALAMMALTRQ